LSFLTFAGILFLVAGTAVNDAGDGRLDASPRIRAPRLHPPTMRYTIGSPKVAGEWGREVPDEHGRGPRRPSGRAVAQDSPWRPVRPANISRK